MKSDLIQRVDGKFYMKSKVVMLPTEHAVQDGGHIWFNVTNSRPYIHPIAGEGNFTPQYLYFLSDEEIKVGDWYFDGVDYILQKTKHNSDLVEGNKEAKKIIATTDSSLTMYKESGPAAWNEPLSRPSDAFIQKYVEEQGKIEEVLIEIQVATRIESSENYDLDEIWILDQKVKDVFSDEEYNLNQHTKVKVASDNTITIKKVRESWDDILQEYYASNEVPEGFSDEANFLDYLIKYYLVPKKK